MSVIVCTSFGGPIPVLAAAPLPPAQLTQDWNKGLQNSASKINSHINANIPNGAAFDAKIANPSSSKYAGFINPSYTSKGGSKTSVAMTSQQATKLSMAYNNWLTGVTYMFGGVGTAQGQNFKNAVNAKAQNWAQGFANFVYSTTGSKDTSKGPVVYIQELLTGNNSVAGLIPMGWGSSRPYNIILNGFANQFKASFTGLFIQAIQLLTVSGFDSSVVSAVNAKLVVAMNALEDPALANPFLMPDATPGSSLILSQGASADEILVTGIIRQGAP
jgi:hypothetical protein